MDMEWENMSPRALIQRLRAAAPAAQAQLLREALCDPTRGSIHGITTTLLDGITGGHAPPSVISTWLGVSRSPDAMAKAFFQSGSVQTRNIAIKYMSKMLRNDKTFESTWRALGETQGIGQYMANLSINQHRELCSALGRLHKPNDGHVQRLRRTNITELYDFLMNPSTNTNEARPVKPLYARLLPACKLERAEEYLESWDEDDLDSPQKLKEMQKLVSIDWHYFEQRAFDKVSDPSISSFNMKGLRVFVDHNQNFGLRILELLASNNKIQISDTENFMDCLALPLARHCPTTHRSNPDIEEHNHLWKLINMVLERHPALREELDQPFKTRHYGSHRVELTLLEYAARSWNHCRGDEERSTHMAGLIRFLPSSWFSFDRVGKLLKRIAPSLRYEFFRIWLANSASHRHDIGRPDGWASMSLKGLKIPVMIFTILGAADSLNLFERCLAETPDCSFLDVDHHDLPEPAILRQKQEPDGDMRPDSHVLRAFLIKRAHPQKAMILSNPEAIIDEIRSVELERRKKLAQEAKESETRGFWALSAIHLCVALRDFDLLDGTLNWARRFNKDPMAVRCIYPCIDITPFLAYGTMTAEAPVFATKTELAQIIAKANHIVKSLLDTVMTIQNEKSFVDWHLWDGKTVRLAARVAIMRLRKLKGLRESLQLTDEEMYDAILKPTVEVLIMVESILIDYESVDSRGRSSMLSFGSDQVGYDEHPPSEADIRFWDTLARRRNELWEQKRSGEHTEVMTLPPPWPRGLPIQHLIPSEMQDNLPVPYVVNRAEAIILCDPAVVSQAPPEDKDVQKAIGSFIDSYSGALRLWVRAVEDKKEQQQRIIKAWNYALGPLTGDRMSSKEAKAFWYSRAFASVEDNPEVTVQWDPVRFPAALPSQEDNNVAMEWDPDPDYDQRMQFNSRRIECFSQLDCMLSERQSHISTMGDLYTNDVYIKGFWGACWNKDAWKTLLLRSHADDRSEGLNSTIDALIAAALITMDAVHGRGSVLLRTPFPSAEDPRFPAMYLDQEFLERESPNAWMATWALESLRRYIPAQLLVQLADSLWTKLKEATETQHGQYHIVASVIKLIIESDDPKLAFPIIQRFVTEAPDASSYFRDIFGVKLMNRLSSQEAAMFYKSMTEHVTTRLSEQQSQPRSEGEPDDRKSAPFVKITTVKMLAQLPREGIAIGTQQALDTLCNLFLQSSHIDVKSAALQSLHDAAVDEGSRDLVNNFIHQRAVKIAGSLNERRPHTEEDWAAAEQGGPLPEVDADHPILDMLLIDDSLNIETGFSAAREALIISAENNVRWMRLFAKRHGSAAGCQPEANLLSIPAGNDYLATYLERITESGNTPERGIGASFDTLAAVKSYVLTTMNPPEWIEALNKHVDSSALLSRSNAGQHWLHMWHSSGLEEGDAKWQCVGGTWASGRLNEALTEEEDSGQLQFYLALENFVGDMAELCLQKGNVEALMGLVDKLRPQWNSTRACVDEERGSGKVIRGIIDKLDRLRTHEWQADPHRQPSRLPDSTLLSIELLRLPDKDYDEFPPSGQSHIDRFVEKAISITDVIANGSAPHEPRFKALCERVDEHCGDDRMYIARLIGNVNTDMYQSKPSMTDMLRVRLAVFVLNEADGVGQWESDDGIACREMIQRWEGSSNEELREQAFAFKKGLPDRLPSKPNVLEEWFS